MPFDKTLYILLLRVRNSFEALSLTRRIPDGLSEFEQVKAQRAFERDQEALREDCGALFDFTKDEREDLFQRDVYPDDSQCVILDSVMSLWFNLSDFQVELGTLPEERPVLDEINGLINEQDEMRRAPLVAAHEAMVLEVNKPFDQADPDKLKQVFANYLEQSNIFDSLRPTVHEILESYETW